MIACRELTPGRHRRNVTTALALRHALLYGHDPVAGDAADWNLQAGTTRRKAFACLS